MPVDREPGTFPIVGIGASAGGLEACKKLLVALPPQGTGMAFILVQHLDPTHESMMVDLLAPLTTMTVVQADDGMRVEKEHLYVIPPATYLTIANGTLYLSRPKQRHGARLPFDHLLLSLADACGRNAICVVLSGTGADGSLGLKAIKGNFGLVIAQTPEEAGFDGMPRSAIHTGAVDLVLDAAKIPEALAKHAGAPSGAASREAKAAHYLPEIIDLLRAKTPHDFRLYKAGTLRRRIERRMAMASIEPDGVERYLKVLRNDEAEVGQLAEDLLINVTGFFRDPKVFDYLATEIIPDLVRPHRGDQQLRVWVAGCSTGEETYSLAMLFAEEITAQKLTTRLQLFASDVDPGAIAVARDGFYPDAIEADVSAPRLARFFLREEHGYRVHPDLRASVVFAVQDVLADPPFSRLDFISCRNLLIYLLPEAQARVISLFHFALRDGGILLLGSAETVGGADGRFKMISRTERIYRHVGRSRPGEVGFPFNAPDALEAPLRLGQPLPPSRQSLLAGLCRRLVMETYAPAAVLVDRNLECLYSCGPTDRYLRVPAGHPSQELLAMVRPEVRTILRSAIPLAWRENRKMSVDGGLRIDHGAAVSLRIDLLPITSKNEELMLVCFLDQPAPSAAASPPASADSESDLERTLAATRLQLQTTLRNFEIADEEHKAATEEALSVNEEYQSTNEELLTSKEELQSLNEELTALNSQLQETLEKQRTASNDLQNVLYSTDVATIFLDTELKIRFFTPMTKSLFNVIPGDIGRPLADLHSLAADSGLLIDAAAVLRDIGPIEREIESSGGACYIRRIVPYRTQNEGVEGVVITFVDVTERHRMLHALEAAKQQAELANTAKSRFLAAASHDLRQPLQTLALLQGFLAKSAQGEIAAKQVRQLGDALNAMAGMLNTLLDINQIEEGTIRAEPVTFPIGDLLLRLQDEFAYQAAAQGLELRAVPSRLYVRSDPRLLEQILRNLLANALKYTKKGGVLFGCRRRAGIVRIEIWDTGIGIADEELLAIFDEYHQLDNPARERSRGLGLGLSIVRRLAKLLDHQIVVRSSPGKGSVFAVEIKQALGLGRPAPAAFPARSEEITVQAGPHGAVLVVEDDPDLRMLLETLLTEEGYFAASAHDGLSALALVASAAIPPDLILTDFNLPNGLNGLQLIGQVRRRLHRDIPAIVLTGEIADTISREIATRHCLPIHKPVKVEELTKAIRHLLRATASVGPLPVTATPPDHPAPGKPLIFLIDDDINVRRGIRALLEEHAHPVEDFPSCEEFLAVFSSDRDACLLVDASLPGMKGLELLVRLKEMGSKLPTIVITGKSDVPMAVQAMKSGASDFLEKPFDRAELIASIERASEQSRDNIKLTAWHDDAAARVAGLTPRQYQIMERVLAGEPNKNIAADLNISQRTVEHHRAAIMEKTGSKSLPALARLALAAAQLRPAADNT